MPECYMIERRTPDILEFLLLREIMGYEQMPDEVVEVALSNTLFGVCAMRDGMIMGCGRVIGDGGLYFFIEDVMIIPTDDSESVRACIMDEIMVYLKNNAPKNAFFCIKDTKAAQEHCRQYGFKMDQDKQEEPDFL